MEAMEELGEDLAALVRALRRPLLAAIPLSRRGARARATAFRLRFADGTQLKGSVLPSLEAAERVVTLAVDAGAIIPRIVAHGGVALLSEWVEGETLAGVEWPPSLLRRCGAAQADVHLRVDKAADPADATAHWRQRVTDGLAAMRERQLLEPGELRGLEEIVAAHAPDRCVTSISLGDYSPENIVCRASGEPCLIDFETLSLAPSDYDLGRTWYLWPMSDAQRASFFEGYGARRDASTFFAHRPFWLVGALVQGALFRHREHRPALDVPLSALRALLHRGASD